VTCRQFVDGDGVIYERDRAGDLVAVGHQPPSRPAPGALCVDHAEPYGWRADACPDCVSEVLGGHRKPEYVGLHDPDS
jgi:hypothetical protein